MSRFSGKCDLWDTLVDIHKLGDNSDWSHVSIYQGDLLLPIKSLKDLIKYAPYIISSGAFNNKEGIYVMRITKKAWIDMEEETLLGIYLDLAKKHYRSYKRKKKDFVPEEVAIKMSFHSPDTCVEICRRVAEHPYSARVDGLALHLHDLYREEWLKAMLDHGYSEDEARNWVYKGGYVDEK